MTDFLVSGEAAEVARASRPLKIMHVVSPARVGGLERVVSALARGQKAKGSDVHVAALIERGMPEPPLVVELRDANVTVATTETKARAFVAQRRFLQELSARVEPDVLHTHGYLPDVLSASLGRKLEFARVSTVHGFTGGDVRNRLYEWMQRQSYRRFNCVIAVSRKLGVELAPRGPSRSRTVTLPNAWSPARAVLKQESARSELGLRQDRFIIGWVGRISHEKGLDILIDSLAALSDLPFHVAIIGAGAELNVVKQKAVALGLDNRISWSGELVTAAHLMSAFDVLVISSRTEGTPIVLFEAMEARVPVVAAAVGGIPDVMSSTEGILVPVANPGKLAAAIRTVYESPTEAAARASRAAARLHENFALSPWIDAHQAIYESVIEVRHRR